MNVMTDEFPRATAAKPPSRTCDGAPQSVYVFKLPGGVCSDAGLGLLLQNRGLLGVVLLWVVRFLARKQG